MSGILSAYGIALADIVEESQEATAATLSPDVYHDIARRLEVGHFQLVLR